MGQAINGFIGRTADCLKAFLALPDAVPCPLNQGYLFLPFVEPLYSGDDLSSQHAGLIRLTQPLEVWAIAQSQHIRSHTSKQITLAAKASKMQSVGVKELSSADL